MLRRLIAVALVAGGVALPACAQRGGGARGGSMGHSGGFASGGFASHSAPAFRGSSPSFRGSFTPMGRTSFMGAPQSGGNRTVGVVPALRGGPVRNGPGVGGRRPVYGYAGTNRYRRPYAPYYGVGSSYVVGWLGPDFLDYPASGTYDNSGYAATPPPVVYPAGGYATQPVEQAEAAPDNSFRPAYQRPEPEPPAEYAVTLVFKDGRPMEEIHNYLLTRTTLYVQEQRLREIAVADLDLAATEKVNRDAGVDFRLPDSGR